jgi:hypothetical protein
MFVIMIQSLNELIVFKLINPESTTLRFRMNAN